jgi:uncharacterized membrane protein
MHAKETENWGSIVFDNGEIVVSVLSFFWICYLEMYANCMQQEEMKKGFNLLKPLSLLCSPY